MEILSGFSESLRFSGTGEVYSFTIVRESAEEFREFTPYVLALVKLSEGTTLVAQITDVEVDEVYLGMPVEMVTRVLKRKGEQGLIVYGYKFRPKIK